MSKPIRLGALFLTAGLAVAGCTTQTAEVSRGAANASPTEARVSTANQPNERVFPAYLTGYSYWDNTPPGSAAIARPVIRSRAGGTGTYNNPITIAVGHSINGGRQTLDYREGTRFYIRGLRKYAIVEDVCGDGGRPQDGPCHTGHRGLPWLDIWVGGANAPRQDSVNCMYRLTRVHTIIQNPRPDYPVVEGPLTESGCQVFPS